MNDSELESNLKRVPLPVRTEGYWERFPSRVRSQLRPGLVSRPPGTFSSRLTWGSAIACAGMMLALALWPAFHVVSKDGPALRRELAQLPHHLHVLMANEHGMHYLIADQP